ncbi:hypothetical protein [Candidatus Thioglobus sp.]|jgi:hypothetical protein|uniref:hypothetical protein n=1 Tax=Candidatus Thioglobus sp. TaxID=2026721 RepID=UPI001D701ACB|nr:hypothetical protein [Candidatus Thioglobus sp.]MBT3277473.1 hypothetical protein [Candidatus Thioglobus sp.]MBT3447380.1 hypothetical protein [Candidatus Thioglobus sp.]MBT3745183.1 hypothetical protein [Candidatus Thioglobus sp.]MBT4001488.1 hypothetical protein [Candidatus Thioglobus sp.]MBT4181492.1 hypothetical protein [Candidatus Thioglobus sp.]
MKPNTVDAMHGLIQEIQNTLPFDQIKADFCSDTCSGCSIKLIDFLSTETEHWQYRLNQGDIPNFNDLNKLAKMAKKIQAVLLKNGLV